MQLESVQDRLYLNSYHKLLIDMETRKDGNVSTISGNWKYLLSICTQLLTTTRGVNSLQCVVGGLRCIIRSLQVHFGVTSTLYNHAEVEKFMPQHTTYCAIHLPVALTL